MTKKFLGYAIPSALAMFVSSLYTIIDGIFTSNAEILEIAYNGLNITNIGFFIVGLNLTTTVYYQAVENPKYSNLLCVLRSVIFLPISVFVLVKLMGVNGVWISLLSSEFLSLIVVKFVADVKSYTKSNVAV